MPIIETPPPKEIEVPDYPTGTLSVQNPSASGESVLDRYLGEVLSSEPIRFQKKILSGMDQEIIETPLIWKEMPGSFLRVIFQVTTTRLTEGTVVSVVTLHDMKKNRTLYAHPMHAGPGVNPLLEHLEGPMAAPKAQPGENGDRATRRMIEHKKALWKRFLEDRATEGEDAAAKAWKSGYYWALRRLYFCAYCSPCAWGSPFFEDRTGKGPGEWRGWNTQTEEERFSYSPRQESILSGITASEIWKVESDYAARGDFRVLTKPFLMVEIGEGLHQVVFPTDARVIEGGSLVGLAVLYDEEEHAVLYAHCLSMGPKPEILFMRGESALGLPVWAEGPDLEALRAQYRRWREEAWTAYWLDELSAGIQFASQRWLAGFRNALADLFGGNDLKQRE